MEDFEARNSTSEVGALHRHLDEILVTFTQVIVYLNLLGIVAVGCFTSYVWYELLACFLLIVFSEQLQESVGEIEKLIDMSKMQPNATKEVRSSGSLL